MQVPGATSEARAHALSVCCACVKLALTCVCFAAVCCDVRACCQGVLTACWVSRVAGAASPSFAAGFDRRAAAVALFGAALWHRATLMIGEQFAGAAWCNPRWRRDAADARADRLVRLGSLWGELSYSDSNPRVGIEYAKARSSNLSPLY